MSFDPVSYIMGKQAGGGGGGATVEPLSVTENGAYTAPSGKAYSPVTVNVPNPNSTETITGTLQSPGFPEDLNEAMLVEYASATIDVDATVIGMGVYPGIPVIAVKSGNEFRISFASGGGGQFNGGFYVDWVDNALTTAIMFTPEAQPVDISSYPISTTLHIAWHPMPD